jgi:RNA polymerase primary sigma factor
MPSRSEFFASLFDRQSMRKRYPYRDTAFRAYLQDLGPLPLLTAEQEARLLARAGSGDTKAHELLVEANVRMIIAIAARYQGRGLAMLDLIQEGNLGLLRAIERFDPEKGERLSSYAKYWILSGIQRAIAEHGTILSAPIRAGERLQEVRGVIEQFKMKGIEPTPARIAQSLNWPLDQIIELLDLMQKPLDLYYPEEHGMLAERIAAPPMFLSNEVTSPSLLSDVQEIIRQVLTPKQRLVIEARFGLNEEGVIYTYREIADKFFGRIGPRADESIRQLEKSALAKLRVAFGEKEA